jgi:transcriptional regulator with XRE-family HTH domain
MNSTTNHLLCAKRASHRLTIEEVACCVGIEPRTYQRWEQGKHRPHLRSLKRLCQLFACSAEEIGYDLGLSRKRNYVVPRSKDRDPEALDDLHHRTQMKILACIWGEALLRLLLELVDEENLEQGVLLDVAMNSAGRLIRLQQTPDLRAYPNVRIEAQEDVQEMDLRLVLVMGNELDEIFYKIHLRSEHLSKAYFAGKTEFEICLSTPGTLQRSSQNPADVELELMDE